MLAAAVAPAGDTAWLADTALVAFAGIGNPGRFFDLVRSLGGRITAEFAFADHQHLVENDFAADFGHQFLYLEFFAGSNAILFATSLDDRIHALLQTILQETKYYTGTSVVWSKSAVLCSTG